MENTKRPVSTLKDLTKSKLKVMRDCPTQFYNDEYNKDLKEATDAATQQTFDNGRLVETHARTQFCLSIPTFQKITDKAPAVKDALTVILTLQNKDLETITKTINSFNLSDSSGRKPLTEAQVSELANEITEAMDTVVEVLDKANADKRKTTQEFLAQGKRVIFEASFNGNKNTHVQVDILYKNDDGSFDAHEIKSGGGSKMDEYEFDTATQLLVLKRQRTIKINKVYLWHINTQSKDQNQLFTMIEMNSVFWKNLREVIRTERKARKVQQMMEMPKPVFSSKCSSCPYFNTICGKDTVNNPKSVVHLPNFRAKWDLMNSGVTEVNDSFLAKVPDDFKTKKALADFLKANQHLNYTSKNRAIVESILKNERYINFEGIKEDLKSWSFPLRFFDFEAFQDVFPLFKDTKPYEQVVTQFSNLTMETKETTQDKLIHTEWLHQVLDNPKAELVKELINALGTSGSIVSYNMTYEKTRINDLAKSFPEFEKELISINERFVDLMEVIESNIYDPQFYGSYSLKVVSPTLLKIENGCYNDVELKNGSAYTPTYAKMMAKDTPIEVKEFLAKDMKKYCYYDTLNLYLIYNWILQQIEENDKNSNETKVG